MAPTAEFETGLLAVDVLVVWRASGGWHAGTVLYRIGTGPTHAHAPWQEPFLGGSAGDWGGLWDYLAERIREGRGGNVYTYELDAFAVGDPADITAIVVAREAEVVAATHGPLGEVAGTVLFGKEPGDDTIVMPFVLLIDDGGRDVLVATDALDQLATTTVTGSDGTALKSESFVSVEHWQRQGALCWPLNRGSAYIVTWADQAVRFVVAETGGFADIGPAEPPALNAALPTSSMIRQVGGPPHRLDVERVPAPLWITRGEFVDRGALEAAMGEQLEWSFATPWVFRALASPHTHEPILQSPSVNEPGSPFAYWSALLSLLIYSFGWARPDRGLQWWYDAGKPTDDLRLQLLSEVWDADGQLDWFAAWLWTTPEIFRSDALAELTGYHDDGVRVGVDGRWIEAARRSAASAAVSAPFGRGGWDELHLSTHSSGPLGEIVGTPRVLRSSTRERTATLIVDSMVGWYRALAVHGATLPTLLDRSWHVDVVVRPVGCLGTFRRSRATGIWFAGPHRLHIRGT